jgi:N-acetylmuramoyl-L-alanine amidase
VYTGCPRFTNWRLYLVFKRQSWTIGVAEAAAMRSPSAASARRRTARLDATIAVAVLVFSLSASGAAIAAEGAPQSVDFDFPPHGKIRWQRGQTPVLLVYPQRGDGWINLAQRYTGGSGGVAALRSANPKLGTPLRDRPVRVPMELLGADLRLEAVRRVFPVDERVDAGWRHLVLDPFHGGEESWKWLAALFAGAAERATELKRANPQLAAQGLERGRWVLVPESGLLPVFKRLTPVPTPTPIVLPTVVARPSAAIAATTGPLQYGADELGEYAVYRLRQGEALYSAVVVRFTGQLLAVQVNETAMEIAARSGIDDVTDIPVGYPIKIPLDLLLPDYLPPDDPRRVVWDEERRDLGRFLEVVQATDLAGVQVILDAGHGGKDSGAVVDGWWEATYAYDIMCRIKVNLERHTRATVWTTIEQTVPGYVVPAVDRLDQRRDARLLTRPPYPLVDSVLGVHLRWYLTNDIILNRLGAGFPRSKTVFLSVHADSLHPSVRGAMVYVPSRYLRPTEPYTVKHREINRYAEYRNHPTVRFGTDFKARVEASSRHLANSIIASLEDNQIGVHPYEPVRDRVLRGRRSWVPAVLRYTAAQNAVLVEACNMSNPQDRALLLQAQWREEFARAVVEGMASAFAK